MSQVLDDYKQLKCELPDINLSWRMREAGVQYFGRTGKPDALPMPKPNRDQVLLRVDAIGICFSDVKLITQGSSHPRITGRDLAKDPVVPGHEVSLTVVEAGDDWKEHYRPGDRYIVQPDVFYNSQSVAFGYLLPGGMQQFVLVGEQILHGDEGSYLIPIKSDISYAEAALVEPWTCAVAAYRIKPRRHIKPGSYALIVGTGGGSYAFDGTLCANGAPKKIVLAGVSESTKSSICTCSECSAEVIEVGKLKPEDVKPLSQERTGARGFDDIIILGTPDPGLVEALNDALTKRGVMAFVATEPMSREVQIDVGRVHYDRIDYIGSKISAADAYASSRDSELVPGGVAWFIGAAGPMGQMHVQRAANMKNGPKKILCTDVDNDRLDYLKAAVVDDAAANGLEIVFLNPAKAGSAALDAEIERITAGRGFDDIVVLAPIASLVGSAVGHLAEGGLMNIFAGIPKGTMANIGLSAAYMRGSRFLGSSGSRPQDMVDTLAYTESGELPVMNSVAAIGGIDAMAEGVRAVKDTVFPGKTVIFPQISMPLAALTDLQTSMPNVFAKLKDGKFWTKEAEEELLASKLNK